MDLLFSILGLLGAVCCVSMFYAIEQGRLDGNSMAYYIINGIGGALILAAVFYDYDPGDLGSMAVETAWVVISGMGIIKLSRKGKPNA